MTDQPAARTPDTARVSRTAARRPSERLWRKLLGERLRAVRRERRESLAVVADRANLSLQYLSEVERGVKEPSSEVVAAIVAALDVTLLDLTAAVAEQLRSDLAASARVERGDVALAA